MGGHRVHARAEDCVRTGKDPRDRQVPQPGVRPQPALAGRRRDRSRSARLAAAAPGFLSGSGLIDVTQVPLASLRLLDDAVLNESVGQLVRKCDSIGDRRWDSPQRIIS